LARLAKLYDSAILQRFDAPSFILTLAQMSMAVLAGATSHTSTTTGIVAAVFLFVFNSFFAVGWLGMTWLYPGK
jgi:hypothetical protein